MSDPQSPVKRSSRTPKLSAKKLAFEEENSQKRRRTGEPKTPTIVTPTPLKAKSPAQSAPRRSKKKSSTPRNRTKSQTPKQPPVSEVFFPEEKEPSPGLYEDNDLDVVQLPDSVSLIVDEVSSASSFQQLTSPKTAEAKRKRNRKSDGGNSDDEAEEKWLQALESGKLEEIDSELKSIKDPKLMTARQRAVIEAKQARVEHLQQVQAIQEALKDQHASEQMTEEVIEKRAIKAAKRKQLAEAKRDKEKKDTIKRLLKKNDSRQKLKKLQKQKSQLIPKISYRYNSDGVTISFPAEAMPEALGIDLTPKTAQYPTPILCSNPGCENLKKYQCSSNALPVCSLSCYKQVSPLPPLAQLLEVATTVAEASI